MGQYADPELGVARSYISSNIKQGVPFNNMAGYSNPKIDELFAKGAAETDEKKRTAIYSELQKALVDDVAFVWFLELEQPHFVNKKFKNVITSPLGNKDDFESVHMVQ
jgi:peptide/nickel transport system substrate-binding protein